MGVRPPWKKLLTQAQLVQVVVIMAHSLYHLAARTPWPTHLPLIELAITLQMLWMFRAFFVRTYTTTASRDKDE